VRWQEDGKGWRLELTCKCTVWYSTGWENKLHKTSKAFHTERNNYTTVPKKLLFPKACASPWQLVEQSEGTERLNVQRRPRPEWKTVHSIFYLIPLFTNCCFLRQCWLRSPHIESDRKQGTISVFRLEEVGMCHACQHTRRLFPLKQSGSNWLVEPLCAACSDAAGHTALGRRQTSWSGFLWIS